MRKLLTILFFVLSLSAYTQSVTWVAHNDSLFMKRGSDSIYYNENMFFDVMVGIKNTLVSSTNTLTGKQNQLVSGTNIRTINGNSLLGSSDLVIGGGVAWGGITGTLSNQTDLQTALNAKQATITLGTTAQYFRGDLSLSTFPTTTAPFTNSTDKNFVTDAKLTVVNNTTGTNSGDNAVNTLYSGLVSNANHTGDATGSTALTLATVNGNVGSFGSATQVPTYTVNAKGLITAASNTTIAIPQSAVTNLTTDLALKAPLASPAFTGTPTGITATHVGLGNVTNESKATMFTNPSFTGTPTGIGLPVVARVTGSNFTTTGQALVDITGLSIALAINATYEIEANLSVSTTAVTTGTQYGINYSVAGGTIEAQIFGAFTTTAAKNERVSVLNTATSAFLTTSAQTGGVRITGIVTTGANAGNLTVKTLKVTSGTSTVFINSYLKVTRIL